MRVVLAVLPHYTAPIPFMAHFELGDAKIRSTPVCIDIAPLYSERAS